MVEIKEKNMAYKLVVNTRDDSITLEGALETVITIGGKDIRYKDRQTKFVGYVQTVSENETNDVKRDMDEILNARLEKYINGLKVLEKTAKTMNAEIEIE